MNLNPKVTNGLVLVVKRTNEPRTSHSDGRETLKADRKANLAIYPCKTVDLAWMRYILRSRSHLTHHNLYIDI